MSIKKHMSHKINIKAQILKEKINVLSSKADRESLKFYFIL